METLHSQLEAANLKLEIVQAHLVCAVWEIRGLKKCLNSKTNVEKQEVQVNTQHISSAEVTCILEEHDCEEAEKREREEEVQVAKKARDNQQKQQHEAGSIMFASSLNSKIKDDLLNITCTLQLTSSNSNTKETKVVC